jgi:hypothetical protein
LFWLALATAVGAIGPSPAAAHGTADACTNAGVTSSIARKAYGETATIAPLTEPGNLPKALADVPVCFVFAHHGLVATVRLYSPGAWSELIAIYNGSSPRPRHVPVNRLGPGAALYDVSARPGHYEEDLLFKVENGVVTLRSRVLPFRDPPGSPLSGLATLARGLYTGRQAAPR